MVWLAVFLAVMGAFFLAFGAQRQGSAVKADTGGLALSSNGFLRLLRNRRWVFGLLLLCTGMVMNATALVTAPLTVVQPIGAIALVVTSNMRSPMRRLPLGATALPAATASVTCSSVIPCR